MAPHRVRAWCGTLNNYDDNELARCTALIGMMHHAVVTDATYLVFQREIGAHETPHIQLYVELQHGKSMDAVKTFLQSDRWHLEVRRGTPKEASDYCKKEDTRVPDTTYWEAGILTEQGKRNDWEDIRDALRGGATDADIVLRWPGQFGRNSHGVQAMRCAMYTHREAAPTGAYMWGEPNTHKTTYASKWNQSASYYIKDSSQWWDGYTQQDVIVLDDWEPPTEKNVKQVLDWADWKQFRVQYKGGYIPLNSKNIVICSNYSWDDFVAQLGESHKAAMKRRFPTCIHFNAELNAPDLQLPPLEELFAPDSP